MSQVLVLVLASLVLVLLLVLVIVGLVLVLVLVLVLACPVLVDRHTHLHHLCYRVYFSHSRSQHTNVINGIRQ